jgi:hypothetical protein
MSAIREKSQKYCLLLCLFGLFFETYIKFKRQALIMTSLQKDYCPYILNAEDLEFMKKIILTKQLQLWTYRKASDGDIGSFVPLAMMQDIKRQDVEKSNQEVNKRLSRAIKKLIEENELKFKF